MQGLLRHSEIYDIEINNCLGQGTFGSVHACTLKLCSLRKCKPRITAVVKVFDTKTPTGRYAFDNERLFLHHIKNVLYTPNVYYVEEGCIYMTPGCDSLFNIHRKRKLSTKTVYKWCQQLLKAVCSIHAKDIVHRDIKPANCVFTKADDILLVDWNSASFYSGATKWAYCTTEPFRAPELFLANEETDVDYKAVDVWSLACTMVYLLYKVNLFSFDGKVDPIVHITSRLDVFYANLVSAEELTFWRALFGIQPGKRARIRDATFQFERVFSNRVHQRTLASIKDISL